MHSASREYVPIALRGVHVAKMGTKHEHNRQTAKPMTKAILRALQRQSSSMAFSAHMVEESNHAAAFSASLAILEQAQADCLDRPIPPEEIEDAIAFLSEGCSKRAYYCNQFRKGLALPDQGQRFEMTSQSLRALRK